MVKYPLTASSTGGQKVQVASALGDIDSRLADLELLKLQELPKTPIARVLGWGNQNKGLQWLSNLPNIDGIQFNTEYVQDSHTEGLVHWNSSDGTLEVDMPGGQVSLQVGQEMLVRVRNETGSTITDGSVVWNTGSSGNKPLIALADALSTSDPRQTGMATEDIEHNSNGYVNLGGMVRGLDTSAHVEGTSLYLSTTPGLVTATAPTSPDHVYWIAVVTRQHADEGSIYHKPTMPLNVSSLSDFNGTDPDTTNKHIVWNDAAGYWDADQVDHVDLLSIGTNSHAAIDTHIADSTLHYTVGSIDHGSIAGLADDDHTIYLLADGSRGLTGDMTVTALKTIDGRDLSVDGAKLDGIESLADVTDATNVAAAGAAMSGGAFHDGFSDFVSDEHVAHAGVVPGASTGLTVTGTDIASSFSYAFTPDDLTVIIATSLDRFIMLDQSDSFLPKVATISTVQAVLNHDSLSGFVADEHIDWTNSTAGTIHPTNYADNDTTDHTALSNIGTNTHAQVDTHLALVNEHIDWSGSSAGTIHISNVNVEDGATTDQTDAEIETAYNAQVGAMSQATAEAGVSTTVERVTAERIAQAIAALGGGGGGATVVYKTADQAKVSTISRTTDADLQVALVANGIYRFEMVFVFTAHASGDFKLAWARPTGMALHYHVDAINTGTTSLKETALLTINGAGTTSYKIQHYMGYIVNGANAGTFGLSWAQAASHATATTLRQGSWMEVTQLN